MQLDVLAARNDLQRVKLQILHLPHGLLCAGDATPATAGPQALLAEDEAAGYIKIDSQHNGLS
jgi:hypothetical protein